MLVHASFPVQISALILDAPFVEYQAAKSCDLYTVHCCLHATFFFFFHAPCTYASMPHACTCIPFITTAQHPSGFVMCLLPNMSCLLLCRVSCCTITCAAQVGDLVLPVNLGWAFPPSTTLVRMLCLFFACQFRSRLLLRSCYCRCASCVAVLWRRHYIAPANRAHTRCCSQEYVNLFCCTAHVQKYINLYCCTADTQEYINLFNDALVSLEEDGVMSDLQTMWIKPPGGCTSKSDSSNLAQSKISIQVRSEIWFSDLGCWFDA